MTSTTDMGQRVSCNYCRGHGQVPNYGNGEDFYGAKECPFCHGSGTVYRGGAMEGSMIDIQALAEQALRDHAECSGCDVEALAHAALSLARQLAEADHAFANVKLFGQLGAVSLWAQEIINKGAARHAEADAMEAAHCLVRLEATVDRQEELDKAQAALLAANAAMRERAEKAEAENVEMERAIAMLRWLLPHDSDLHGPWPGVEGEQALANYLRHASRPSDTGKE